MYQGGSVSAILSFTGNHRSQTLQYHIYPNFGEWRKETDAGVQSNFLQTLTN
jgi:hypothetical protein